MNDDLNCQLGPKFLLVNLGLLLLLTFHFSLFFCHKALGTKRLASEELVHNWDNKRLNAGQVSVGSRSIELLP